MMYRRRDDVWEGNLGLGLGSEVRDCVIDNEVVG